jgi:hypothetical protein
LNLTFKILQQSQLPFTGLQEIAVTLNPLNPSRRSFPAPTVRFDFNHCHRAGPAVSSDWLDGIICGGSSR